jgi:hypothetical protein
MGGFVLPPRITEKGGARVSHGLSDLEFIRRFSLHVLPKGFVRIRHYGILSSSRKKIVRPLLMVEMGQPQPKPGVRPILHRKCPKGKEGALVTVFMFDSRGHRSRWKRAAREIGGLISNEGPKVNFFKISIGIRLGVSPTHKVNDSLSW